MGQRVWLMWHTRQKNRASRWKSLDGHPEWLGVGLPAALTHESPSHRASFSFALSESEGVNGYESDPYSIAEISSHREVRQSNTWRT